MKIGFDAKRLFHNNTGLGNYARTLVRNLYELYPEHEYHLFTPYISNHNYARFFLENNFIIHTKPNWLNSGIWRTIGMSKKINVLNLDIYHGLSHEIPFLIGSKTKSVVTFHDLIYELKPKLFPLLDRLVYKLKYKSSCNRADHIIAISHQTLKDLEAYYNVANKVTCIYQSCNEIFQTEPSLAKASKNHFLYVGTLNERKGLLNIVQAYALLPEKHRLPFLVIGDGGAYKAKVIDLVQKNNLEKFFSFKGNVDNAALIQYYDDSIGLILPSLYEGFGIPIIESLFRRRPVITSSISSLPEACGPGGILIDPSNYIEIADAMQQLFDNQVWNSLSENGYAYVNDHFSSKSISERLMTFYYEII